MHLPAFLTFLVSTFFHQSDFEPLDIQEPARIDAFSPAPAYVPASAAPAVRHVDLVIQNGDLAPDGYLRSAVLSGDSFPGTLIRGYKGDRFRINVTNLLTDNQTMETSTSIVSLLCFVPTLHCPLLDSKPDVISTGMVYTKSTRIGQTDRQG
jgi:FtsP/CotA-like multicopper oxidase with cupredoxin domain